MDVIENMLQRFFMYYKSYYSLFTRVAVYEITHVCLARDLLLWSVH